MGFKKRRKWKVAMQAHRQRQRGEEVAAPALEGYKEYYPKAMKAQWQALQMPSVKGLYAGEESAMRGRLSRFGMGGGGAVERGQRNLRREMAGVLGRMQFGQAGQYGAMAGQALGAGQFGHAAREGGWSGLQAYHQRNLASARAGERARRAYGREMPWKIAEMGLDVGAALLTGGPPFPPA